MGRNERSSCVGKVWGEGETLLKIVNAFVGGSRPMAMTTCVDTVKARTNRNKPTVCLASLVLVDLGNRTSLSPFGEVD